MPHLCEAGTRARQAGVCDLSGTPSPVETYLAQEERGEVSGVSTGVHAEEAAVSLHCPIGSVPEITRGKGAFDLSVRHKRPDATGACAIQAEVMPGGSQSEGSTRPLVERRRAPHTRLIRRAPVTLALALAACRPPVVDRAPPSLTDQRAQHEATCRGFLAANDPFQAFDTCHGIITNEPSAAAELSVRLEALLAIATESAVRLGSPDADRLVLYYSRLTNADRAKLSAWRDRLAAREQEAKRATDTHAAEERRRAFSNAGPARARLRDRYAGAAHMTPSDFEQSIRLMGPPIVDAEITGTHLVVTVNTLQVLEFQAITDLGQIADAFLAQCDCDGVTEVWADATYLPEGKRMPLMSYAFDPAIGHSRLRH